MSAYDFYVLDDVFVEEYGVRLPIIVIDLGNWRTSFAVLTLGM